MALKSSRGRTGSHSAGNVAPAQKAGVIPMMFGVTFAKGVPGAFTILTRSNTYTLR